MPRQAPDDADPSRSTSDATVTGFDVSEQAVAARANALQLEVLADAAAGVRLQLDALRQHAELAGLTTAPKDGA